MGDEDNVIVLSDEDGNIYTITRQLLDLARVDNDEHKEQIRGLIADQEVSAYAFSTGLSLLGIYPSSQGPLLPAKNFTPHIGTSGPFSGLKFVGNV